MQRGFRHLSLPRVRASKVFFEVGVWLRRHRAHARRSSEVRGVGFDISQFALDYTEWMIRQVRIFGTAMKLSITTFATLTRERCDFPIRQEVLEHLENPAEFCTWLFAMVKPGGHAYITAAFNAAHSDHIYLFRQPGELEEMLRAAGFQPLSSQEECASGFKPRRITPSLAGFFCERPA